jgi:hypothetical protein
MKNLYSSAMRCNRKSVAAYSLFRDVIYNVPLYFCLLILIGLLFTACKKEDANTSADNLQSVNSAAVNAEGDFLSSYGLSWQTTWELQQARAATARYRDINNAIKDGYSNINVDVPNMGHHFMKTSLVDATFDIRNPEILVYNGLDTGNPELVAVEYAVPLSYPKPEGFTGSSDVWNDTSGFPLWLVHAWVWKYNPDGVFNWTNPKVDLH